ncbi:ATP-dependent DNA helicase [Frankliniella fusca]|uniref:ATP-dependent DNA helicase n=1 Tax=Frankliniella fusca TaxID=407009 RepID=A0AAE1HJ48_9NEOP|nr:ATP-dependent DNA helicase [Frankliniella fusca]
MRVLCGTFDQSDFVRFSKYFGRQCSANAVAGACKASVVNPRLWTSQTIDECLMTGNRLFELSYELLPSPFNHLYLRPDELYSTLSFPENEITFQVEINEVFDGTSINSIATVSNDGPTNYCLHDAILCFFHNFQYGIFTCQVESIAVMKVDNEYYVFDSHKRCKNGLRDGANGTSVLNNRKVPARKQIIVDSEIPSSSTAELTDQIYDLRIRPTQVKQLFVVTEQLLLLLDDFGCYLTTVVVTLLVDVVVQQHESVKKLTINLLLICNIISYSEPTVHELTLKIDKSLRISDVCIYRSHLQENESGNVCSTCANYLKKGKVPHFAVVNGLLFEPLPEELTGLTTLEERLVSARIPFMQIRELGYQKQLGLKGNCVNVPIDINKTVTCLPRMDSEDDTLLVQLMRRMSDKTPYAFENVRPEKVFNAAKYLVNTQLYKQHKISLNENWLQQFHDQTNDAITDSVSSSNEDDPIQQAADEDDLTDQQDTLLTSGFVADSGIKIAPGEGNMPLSLTLDEDMDVLAFPTVYGGKQRIFKVKYTPVEMAKAEARSHDRRVATNIPKVTEVIARTDEDCTFDEYLAYLNIDEQSYMMALRSKLKRPTGFLKRNLNERRINAYNREMLQLWEAHMDMQLLVSPYGCVKYIVSYVSKSQKGMSKLLKEVADKVARGDEPTIKKLRKIVNAFLNNYVDLMEEDEENDEESTIAPQFKILDLNETPSDFQLEIPHTEKIASPTEASRFPLPNLLPEIKTNPSEPFYHFISGGAGVGKSLLINSIKQVLERFWIHQPNNKPDDIHILPIAPTETKYIVSHNIAAPDGISNGSPCILKKVISGQLCEKGNREQIPIRAYVQFEKETTGEKTRQKLKNIIQADGIADKTWTPIQRICRSFSLNENTHIQVTRNQLPLLPSNAQTIHCSQSCTYKNILVFITKNLSRKLLYTAFSRVESLQGLHISGIYKKPIRATIENDPSLREMIRMRNEAQLQFSLTFPEEVKNDENIIALFHNVRSLNLHFPNVCSDRTLLACDIIMLAETWSQPADRYEIDNFTIVYRTDCAST